MARPSRRELEKRLDALDSDDGTDEFDDVGVVEQLDDGRYRDFETGEILDPEDVEIVADFTGVDP